MIFFKLLELIFKLEDLCSEFLLGVESADHVIWHREEVCGSSARVQALIIFEVELGTRTQ